MKNKFGDDMGKIGIGTAGGGEYVSSPESSVFSVDDAGDLILNMRSTLYPAGGGAACGGGGQIFNFSAHLRQLIRQEVRSAMRDGGRTDLAGGGSQAPRQS